MDLPFRVAKTPTKQRKEADIRSGSAFCGKTDGGSRARWGRQIERRVQRRRRYTWCQAPRWRFFDLLAFRLGAIQGARHPVVETPP